MRAPAKFLFDLDFAAGPKAANAVALAEHKTGLAEAETRGYRMGFSAAQAEAEADTSRRMTAALEKIAGALDQLARGLKSVEDRLEAEAVEVAVAVANKLAAELVSHEPLAEIAALVTDCFRELTTSPHIVVRISDALYPQAQSTLEEISRKTGFEGRLVVLGESEIPAGDCRIEWADGGMTRDRAMTEAAIAETVGRYVAVRRAGAGEILKGDQP